MSDTVRALIDLAARQFNKDASQLGAETDFFRELGINSFQALQLLSEVEKRFKVEIPDYELQGVNTFAQLADVVDSRK